MQLSRRLARVLATVAAVLAANALWDIHPVVAQSPSERRSGGCLSFHEVHPKMQAHAALQTQAPSGFKIYLLRQSDRQEQGLVLREASFVSGDDLADAQASVDAVRTGEPILELRFSAAGARELASLTKENIGRPVAVVVDGRVISAPVIQGPILGGVAMVSGNLSGAEAAELAGERSDPHQRVNQRLSLVAQASVSALFGSQSAASLSVAQSNGQSPGSGDASVASDGFRVGVSFEAHQIAGVPVLCPHQGPGACGPRPERP